MTLNPRPGPRFPSKTAPGPRGESAARALRLRSALKNSPRNGKKFRRGAGDGGTRRVRREGRDGARRGRGTAGSPWRICRRSSAACGPRCPPSPRGQWAGPARRDGSNEPMGRGLSRPPTNRRPRGARPAGSAAPPPPLASSRRGERDHFAGGSGGSGTGTDTGTATGIRERHRDRRRDRERGAAPGAAAAPDGGAAAPQARPEALGPALPLAPGGLSGPGGLRVPVCSAPSPERPEAPGRCHGPSGESRRRRSRRCCRAGPAQGRPRSGRADFSSISPCFPPANLARPPQ